MPSSRCPRDLEVLLSALILIPVAVRSTGCATAPAINNILSISRPAFVSGSSYSALYTCLEGYEFWSADASSYNRTCDNGVWAAITDCQPIHCPALPTNAVTVLNDTASTYGTVVEVSCAAATHKIAGLAPGKTLTVSCQSNREWSAAIGPQLCVIIQCAHPAVNHSTWDNASYANVLSTTNYTCLEGYRFPDNSTRRAFQCNATGFWSPSDFPCEAIHCPEISVPNGIIDNPNSTEYLSVAYASCLPGYQFSFGAVKPLATCTSAGTWIPDIGGCQPVQCPNPVDVQYTTRDVQNTTYQGVANYSCVSGYLFADGSQWRISTCNELALWTPQIRPCIPADSLPNPELKHVAEQVEAADAESISALPIGLIGTVVGIVIVLDVITFPIQVAYLKKSVRQFMDRLKPAEPKPEPEPLEFHFPSTVSLGRGRVTPAPSIADLGFVREDRIAMPFGESDPLVTPTVDDARKDSTSSFSDFRPAKAFTATDAVTAKKDRLRSAKASVQRAIEMAQLGNNLSGLTRAKKSGFVPNILPLHADNIANTRGSSTAAFNRSYENESDDDDGDDDDDTSDDSDEVEEELTRALDKKKETTPDV